MRTSPFFAAIVIWVNILWLVACQDNDPEVTPTWASVSALSCGTAIFSASAVSGAAYSGTAAVPYTGSNGATYAAGTAIASTGITGLTATLLAGTLASGDGTLTFALSGTPSETGTATFPLDFGGQTCSLALPVSATGSTTSCGTATGLARVVCLAEAFKATLTAAQVATMQLTYSKASAVSWSNYPQAASNPKRVGISLGSLNATQLAAFKTLMASVLLQNVANEGFDELEGGLVADDYLSQVTGNTSTFGSGNFYLAFLGTPSTTGLWELQYGGHHYAFANTYNGGKITGVTPSFRGVEPTSVTANGKTYQTMEQERQAFIAVLAGLSSTEQATAKLTATFSDVLLGPGKDGVFPTTKQGIQVGNLSAAEKALVLKTISLYVNDLDAETAAPFLAKYTAELDNAYVSFSGTGTMTQEGDYARIDGPSVWIEFDTQGSRDIPGTTHVHSIWRDRTSDYGGN